MKKWWFCLIFIFSCCVLFAQEKTDTQSEEKKEPSIVTIENALKTTSLKNKEEKTDIIRFEGEVVVSVEQGDSKTTIYADFVDFDRKNNSLYAEGSVRMEQSSKGTVSETITANSVLFNTDTLEGFFNQGRVVQENQEALKLSDDATLIVASNLFAKGSENAVSFKNGSLTFCDDPNPHWKIDASRIWLLPGNEFAFLNALLYVGPVPVMYFPFFYYPKDELVFNPSFGFQAREGFFVQTTTYLMGRKPLNSASNNDKDKEDEIGFNFMQQSELKEQRLEGLILRNLDEKAEMPTDYLKIMADYYTTLGGMVGVAGYFEPNDIVKNIEFDTRLGFSNIIFQIEESPLSISYHNDKKYADYGWFLGTKIPFRYGINFETDIKIDNFSLAIALPFYSDPWFNSDFNNRNESMDWIDFFLSGALTTPLTEEKETSTDTGMTGYTWNLSTSYRPKFTFLNPWINTLSIDKLNSSIVFATQNAPKSDFDNEDIVFENSPNRKFFYPSQIKPLNIAVTLGGSLLNWNNNQINQKKSYNNRSKITNDQKKIIKQLIPPSELDIEKTEEKKETSVTEILSEETLPQIKISEIEKKSDINNNYSLKYTIKPNFSNYYNYSSLKPNSNDAIDPEEFLIDNPKSAYYLLKVPVNITSSLNIDSSFISVTNSLAFSPEIKKHFELSSDYYTESEKKSQRLSDYKTKKMDLKNTNTISVKPLKNFELLKNTSLSWNSSVNVIDTSFIGTVENPEWDYKTPEWDPESITAHNFNTKIESHQDDFYQRLNFKSNLPPQLELYSGSIDLGFPYLTTSIGTGYKKISKESKEWEFQPLTQNSTLKFFEKTKDGKDNPYKLTLKQNYTYDLNESLHENFLVSLLWNDLTLSYSMKQSYSYTLDILTGWVPSKKETFLPSSLSLKWNFNNYEYENKPQTVKLQPEFSTEFNWDMIIPTKSYLSFTPSLEFEINNLLKIKFSSESRNNQLIRYIQNIIGFSPVIPGETNFFVDLWNSFNFWDESKRTSSGFKIESFNIDIEYDLHDWTLASRFEIEPRIITKDNGTKYYDYSPYFTLAIKWKPMPSIKTTIEDEYGEFTVNPQK